MNYQDLIQANIEDDKQRRLKSMENLTDKELAAIASNPVSDARSVVAAKQLLTQRGIEGINHE